MIFNSSPDGRIDNVWEVIVAVLLAIIVPVHLLAQRDEQLPLRTARPNAEVRNRLKDDWYIILPNGREYSYCANGWTPELDQDGDTVDVVTSIQLVHDADARDHGISGFDCKDKAGHDLPIIHSHPSGDCTPSRADIEVAAGRHAPFEMIVCGPQSTVSYTGNTYRLADVGHEVMQRQRQPEKP